MERWKQTGHICRWMALGITIATIVVGCTIVVGLLNGATEAGWRTGIKRRTFW
uniref:hypothetical protein n=1 Tax=Prevotella sp. TaxID=59823 RepID=UPI004024B5B5